ncbi:MAG: metallophosphoesterase family protein [Verrucomicrobiota bacterium]
MKIGIISDTHGFLDPRVEKIFSGVDHILHAGDIGYATIILELQFIAPVTAVLGNCDDELGYRLTETVLLAQKKFLVQHIVNPLALTDPLQDFIQTERPQAVVFGHTHKRFAHVINGVFYFNPGYAGKPRFGAERSVAIIHCDHAELRHEFIVL